MYTPVYAQGGLVPCGRDTNKNGVLEETEMCQFKHVVEVASKILDFIIFELASVIVVIASMYTGWLFLTSQGNPGTKQKTKTMFGNIIIGYVLVLSSWVIVKTIIEFLTQGSSWRFDSFF